MLWQSEMLWEGRASRRPGALIRKGSCIESLGSISGAYIKHPMHMRIIDACKWRDTASAEEVGNKLKECVKGACEVE